ncbi:MAG: type II secretion system protein GspG [bacterium]
MPADAWGNEFQYYSPGTHSQAPYELISLGKDGQEGGADANADIKSWALEGEE